MYNFSISDNQLTWLHKNKLYEHKIITYRGEQDFLITAKSCFTSIFNGDFGLSNKIIKINFKYLWKTNQKIYWINYGYFSSTLMDNVESEA